MFHTHGHVLVTISEKGKKISRAMDTVLPRELGEHGKKFLGEKQGPDGLMERLIKEVADLQSVLAFPPVVLNSFS